MKHLIPFSVVIGLAAADDWLDWQIRLAGICIVALLWFMFATSKRHQVAANDHADKPFLVHQNVARRPRRKA